MTEIKQCAFRCGNPVHEDKRLCKKHLEHQRQKMREYRASRKRKGLCSRCPNTARLLPSGKPSTLCEDCRSHVRDLEKQARAAAKQPKENYYANH